jgi:transcriptional regulator with XRE-family HTH domain
MFVMPTVGDRGFQITDLSKTIWAIRKRARIGQTNFARELGVNQTQISRYERGATKPELGPLVQLLGMTALPAERRVILRELKRLGIDSLIGRLVQSGLVLDLGAMPTVCMEQVSGATSSEVAIPSPEGPETQAENLPGEVVFPEASAGVRGQ